MEQLRGKTIGISRPGDQTYYYVRDILKRYGIGLKDVRLVQTGLQPERVAALRQGLVVASILNRPNNLVLEQEGYRRLLDIEDLKLPAGVRCLITTRKLMKARPALTENFVMLIVLVDHGMTTGAAAARMTFHSAPEAIQGAVAAAILGAGSVHLGSSEHCAKMLNDALPKDSKETDLDAIALKTVEKRLANNQLIPGIGHGIHTGGDPRAERLFEIAQETKVYGRYCELLKKIGKIANQKVGKRLPVNVTGAIAAISLDMGIHWQMSKSFAILGRALGGLAHGRKNEVREKTTVDTALLSGKRVFVS